MTREEAIYCMKSYINDDSYEHCANCPYYAKNNLDSNVYVCESRTAHEMAIKALEQEPKWIPVSERLPESCGMYIVTRKIYDCPDTEPIIMSDESWFDGQNTWHNDNRINHERGYLSDVIAWMPLPEPYKAEKE